ncbi:MAG TPA: TolC family protein [Polyangia bacterium]|jgi:cobalt-zinc-cadmium efflux system outer membrane protein|nr:TolC family protein [Polyangia bacterium]
MRPVPHVLLALGLLGSGAEAGEGISFDQALGLSATAPDVLGAERAVAVKRQLNRAISSQTQHPQVSLQPGYRLYPESAREPEFIAEVLHSWNLSGLSGARRRSAAAEADVLDAEARALALARRLGAARAWVDAWAAQRLLATAQQQEALAAELERLVTRTTALAETTRADLAEARAFHAEAELAVIDAQGVVFERGLELAMEIGRAATEPLVPLGELPVPVLPPASEWPGVLAQVARLPEVMRREFEARAARARAVEERAARGGLGQFGVALQRDAPGGLVVSGAARIYLPVFDRGERERGGMLAQAERMAGEHDMALAAAVSHLALAFHEVEHTGEALAALESRLVPASDEGARLRERIYQAGEATLPEVLQARRTAMAAAGRLERARADHAWARIKVWLLLASLYSQSHAPAGPDAGDARRERKERRPEGLSGSMRASGAPGETERGAAP